MSICVPRFHDSPAQTSGRMYLIIKFRSLEPYKEQLETTYTSLETTLVSKKFFVND